MTGQELADRCESATAEDAWLLLIEACEAVLLAQGYDPDTNDAMEIVDRFEDLIDAEAYLDAAMTLVPHGLAMGFKMAPCQRAHAMLATIGEEWSGSGSTPALALCAAALRAQKEG